MKEAPHIRLAEKRDIPRIVELYRELTITTSEVEHGRKSFSRRLRAGIG